MKLTHSVISLASVALMFVVSGCATILAPKYDSVMISVQPDSSKIWANGQFMGYSPLHLELDRSKSQLIEVKHEGYEPQRFVLRTTIHPLWISADILLTAGLGAIIDAATGSWNTFSPDIIIMDLSRSVD